MADEPAAAPAVPASEEAAVMADEACDAVGVEAVTAWMKLLICASEAGRVVEAGDEADGTTAMFPALMGVITSGRAGLYR